jgi:hypothetical protein
MNHLSRGKCIESRQFVHDTDYREAGRGGIFLNLDMNKPVIYRVGHSTHKPVYFLELLQAYAVNCVVDVRSIAAGEFNPQYNKEPLSNFLKNNAVM